MAESPGYPNVIAARASDSNAPTDIMMDPTSFALYTGIWVWNASGMAWQKMAQPKTSDTSEIYGYNGTNWRYINSDLITRDIISIDHAHHEIHDGDYFSYTDSVSLNNAGTQDYLVTVPDTAKWPHTVFVMDGSAITQVQIYEGAVRGGTTLQVAVNSNRNSTNEPTTTIHKGISGGTTDGTLMRQYKGGSATNQSRVGTGTRNNEEIILKQNTKYIIRITSGTDTNLVNFNMNWYEHTNKVV